MLLFTADTSYKYFRIFQKFTHKQNFKLSNRFFAKEFMHFFTNYDGRKLTKLQTVLFHLLCKFASKLMDISWSNGIVLIRNKMRINRMFFIFLSDFFSLSYSMICKGARTFGIDIVDKFSSAQSSQILWLITIASSCTSRKCAIRTSGSVFET